MNIYLSYYCCLADQCHQTFFVFVFFLFHFGFVCLFLSWRIKILAHVSHVACVATTQLSACNVKVDVGQKINKCIKNFSSSRDVLRGEKAPILSSGITGHAAV